MSFDENEIKREKFSDDVISISNWFQGSKNMMINFMLLNYKAKH